MLDSRRALPELRDQFGDFVGHCDRFREPLLLGAADRELGFERRSVGFVLRHLRRDLRADLAEHGVQDSFTQHVLLQMLDERGLDFDHRLVNGDRTDRAAAFVVFRAAVAKDALLRSAIRDHTRGRDRATARAALRDAGERVLRRGTASAVVRLARRELRVDREPRRIVHDAPLGNFDRDHLGRIGLHSDGAAALADLLDPAVDVDAAITRVEEDRANGRWRPRSAASTAGGWRRHAFVVERVRDLLVPAPREVLTIDALDNWRVRVVDDSDREASAGTVAVTLELVAVASTAGDSPGTHTRAQTFARARANRLELHLVAGALDERRRLIDRVRELHFLAGGVIEEATTAIADEIANDERHLDRIATEARLIAAHDHVAALGLGNQLAEPSASEKVIASASVIDVVDTRFIYKTHASDVLVTAFGLNVQAELLLAVVVLRSPSIRSDRHP